VNHADLTIVFVQAQNVSALLDLSPKLPTLKIIVAIGEIAAAPRELLDAWSKQRGIRVMTILERKPLFNPLPGLYSPCEPSGGDRRQVSD
jgi:long-chain acyl-CoA synthetase